IGACRVPERYSVGRPLPLGRWQPEARQMKRTDDGLALSLRGGTLVREVRHQSQRMERLDGKTNRRTRDQVQRREGPRRRNVPDPVVREGPEEGGAKRTSRSRAGSERKGGAREETGVGARGGSAGAGS